MQLKGFGERLLIASHNRGKIDELRALLEPIGLPVTSSADLELTDPEETGTTFEENALLKARAGHEATGLASLSDDSGLCIDALGGDPGIYTARWAGPEKDFSMAMRTVEEKLQAAGATSSDQRRAKFVAVLGLIRTDSSEETFRGEVEGTLVWPPRGDQGFGYDPIFQPDGFDITFGEMDADTKHGWVPGEQSGLSHRARAFEKLFNAIVSAGPA
ncbi:MAG: RdgB/HAM1 family non-canonical purine NTP pyrophosphatase [Rhizobiales bacterium]|nr:RdgB/HAM1 family non-canonical purine NTP pyrophosphatase [Hyphomicrobiales bacterium]MBO6699428.1 RdgB/HAM1 family non-canonical purine NTP pyrophosphatase [Hyphomicrobiales bacterium]MBO6736966.1 RdgB/HAM1 family non-canonical purine NTP pyrophosphatase [Hyphomicrobiales bacterium]MBO6911960.1 RdgB/HAM1 family non-canonical purine NTP pyrophosphatase [Hyphomicrobiales bacterium]MBO6957051.1 RdgB/HAM1 family non-canonical purine NTP pyrophosphatase [Hyphomicrobiales bacterium]